MVAMLSSLIEVIHPAHHRSKRKQRLSARHVIEPAPDQANQKSMDAFVKEICGLFEAPLELRRLMLMSGALGKEYKERLAESDISMLPSYQHTLPSGTEKGDFLALDVGGSTLRIALVRLMGSGCGAEAIQTKRIRSFAIDAEVRDLRGQEFFNWMADRIQEMLSEYNHIKGTQNAKLDMGLAWSFPIEQTSQRSGKLLAMGKGFRAAQDVEGQDLSTLLTASCTRKNLNVEMKAVVNDSSATLLSQAYRDPSTRISLILGTGTNAAVYLPTSALGPSKFTSRPEHWHANRPSHVLVNAEMSMVGKATFPTTRWDNELNATHAKPDFQPLEYLSTGRYLGEIVRLVLVDAIHTHNLFASSTPQGLETPYALSTHLLAVFEADATPDVHNAAAAFTAAHPLPTGRQPSTADLRVLRAISVAVTTRAAAYLATALHALWRLRSEAEGLRPGEQAARVTIACNGAVVEKFPGFRDRVQGFLERLVGATEGVGEGEGRGVVVLRVVGESSVEGAAVAVGCAEGEE